MKTDFPWQLFFLEPIHTMSNCWKKPWITLWYCVQNRMKNTRKICVWMLAILAVVKRCTRVVIRPIFVPAARKRRNWNATRTSEPAVGSLRSHTLFSTVFVNCWSVMKRKLPIIWLSFSLLALLLSGANSCPFIVNRGLHSSSLVQVFPLRSFSYLRINSNYQNCQESTNLGLWGIAQLGGQVTSETTLKENRKSRKFTTCHF